MWAGVLVYTQSHDALESVLKTSRAFSKETFRPAKSKLGVLC